MARSALALYAILSVLTLSSCIGNSGVPYASAVNASPGLKAAARRYEIVYRFKGGYDGFSPGSALVWYDNNLYGTTLFGGGGCSRTEGCGTVFAVSGFGDYRVVHHFTGGEDGDGPVSGGLSALTLDGDVLYGTTQAGGGSGCGGTGCGTVFVVHPAVPSANVVYAFKGGSDGSLPLAGVTISNGTAYGASYHGGGSGCGGDGCGTIYALDLGTSVESVLHAFDGPGGASPYAGLLPVASARNRLYGTTFNGGTSNACPRGCGTIFSISQAGQAFRVDYMFEGGSADGAQPWGMVAFNGRLYGTTFRGGSPNCKGGCGTVFEFDPSSGKASTVYQFRGGAAGANPNGLAVMDGKLYGTTPYGGTENQGTIFSIDPSTGTQSVVYSFRGGQDGANPQNALLPLNGGLYGTTANGGGTGCKTADTGPGCGTVFAIRP